MQWQRARPVCMPCLVSVRWRYLWMTSQGGETRQTHRETRHRTETTEQRPELRTEATEQRPELRTEATEQRPELRTGRWGGERQGPGQGVLTDRG